MIRFGLIGCGRIAQLHLKTLARLAEARLCAVSDIDRQKMTRAEQLYAGYRQKRLEGKDSALVCRHYTDYRRLLQDKNIDVVIICTLSNLHADIVRQALKAGKHVIVEKPLALSLKEADEIIALARKEQRHVLVCHQLRYRPLMLKIKQLLEEEALGTMYLGVVSIRICRPASYYAAAPWRGTWLKDGGMLVNQGIHFIDLLQWFLGDIDEVYAEISKGNIPKETEDVALGLMKFTNSARGVIEANTLTYPNNMGYSLSLFGEKGTISIGGERLNQVVRWSVEGRQEALADMRDLAKDDREHEYMYRDFLEVLAGEKENVLINASEGKKALETIFGLYHSVLKHRPQKLPLETFDISKMKGFGR